MIGGDNWRRDRRDSGISKKQKLILNAEEQLESRLGFDLFTEGDKRLCWLLTCASSSWEDRETHKVYSCVDLYFVCQDGSMFKAEYKFRIYFYAATNDKMEMDVEAYLRRRYEGQIADIEIVEKQLTLNMFLEFLVFLIQNLLCWRGKLLDLNCCNLVIEKSISNEKNHLSGLRKHYIKISFDTVQQLMQVKNDPIHVVERNQAKMEAEDAYESILTWKSKHRLQDFIDCINDLCEYDVPVEDGGHK